MGPGEDRVAFVEEDAGNGVVRLGGFEDGADEERTVQTLVLDEAVHRERLEGILGGRPLGHLTGAHEDAKDPADPTADEVLDALLDLANRLVIDDLEGKLFEITLACRGVDTLFANARVGRKVRSDVDPGEQIGGADVTLAHVGTDHEVELNVLIRVRRRRGHSDDLSAIDHLVACDLGEDQMIVHCGEALCSRRA